MCSTSLSNYYPHFSRSNETLQQQVHNSAIVSHLLPIGEERYSDLMVPMVVYNLNCCVSYFNYTTGNREAVIYLLEYIQRLETKNDKLRIIHHYLFLQYHYQELDIERIAYHASKIRELSMAINKHERPLEVLTTNLLCRSLGNALIKDQERAIEKMLVSIEDYDLLLDCDLSFVKNYNPSHIEQETYHCSSMEIKVIVYCAILDEMLEIVQYSDKNHTPFIISFLFNKLQTRIMITEVINMNKNSYSFMFINRLGILIYRLEKIGVDCSCLLTVLGCKSALALLQYGYAINNGFNRIKIETLTYLSEIMKAA